MRWARVLCVLLAWTGPVPVVHDHGTLANATVCNNAFAEHLAHFHGAIDPEADLRLGWHFHWIWPSDTTPAESSQSQFGLSNSISPTWLYGSAIYQPINESLQLFMVPETDPPGSIDLSSTADSRRTACAAQASPLAFFMCSGEPRSLLISLNSLRC